MVFIIQNYDTVIQGAIREVRCSITTKIEIYGSKCLVALCLKNRFVIRKSRAEPKSSALLSFIDNYRGFPETSHPVVLTIMEPQLAVIHTNDAVGIILVYYCKFTHRFADHQVIQDTDQWDKADQPHVVADRISTIGVPSMFSYGGFMRSPDECQIQCHESTQNQVTDQYCRENFQHHIPPFCRFMQKRFVSYDCNHKPARGGQVKRYFEFHFINEVLCLRRIVVITLQEITF